MRFTKMYCNVFIKNVRSLINSYLFQLCYSLNLQAGIYWLHLPMKRLVEQRD